MKRLVALFLVLLLSIESFAATVGDNDGAAFITKAEFDSLKSTFQAQIDQYNSSIDNKIDGAIASYLAGVQTTKVTEVKNLITNLSDLRWVNNIKMKGTMRTWTSPTAKSESTGWMEYPADEKRNLRDGMLDFLLQYAAFNQAGINISTEMLYNGTTPTSDVPNNRFLNSGEGSPIHYILLKDQDDLEFQSGATILLGEEQVTNACWSGPLIRNSSNSWMTGGTDYQLIQGAPICVNPSPNAVRSNTLESGQMLNIDIDCNRINRSTNFTIHVGATPDIGTFPRNWNKYNVDNTTAFNNQTSPVRTDVAHYEGGFFAGGVHLFSMSAANKTSVQDLLRRMMFGRDNDQKTNVLRFNKKSSVGGVYPQYIEYSAIIQVPMKIKSVYVFNERPWTFDNSYVWTGTVPFELGFPLLENVYYRQIRNSYATYEGKKLESGKGIPLVVENTQLGTLKISFSYAINRIIDSKGSENRLYIDLKNENFYDTLNNDTNKFYGGKVNGVTVDRIKDYQVNASDHKVSIEIENFDTGKSIWMRVSPVTEAGGYYATISDLVMTIES